MSEFRHPEAAALVLAAGQGTRMNSDLAKVLHPMAGQPLLAYVLEALEQLGVGGIWVVVGHQRDRVRAAFEDASVDWVVQDPQRGTGHAVMMAAPELGREGFDGTLLVVPGDTPLLTARTLDWLLTGHESSGAAATVLSMRLPDPTGYGRIIRRGPVVPKIPASIERIVEHRDATEEERKIDEVNSGIYAFSYPRLKKVLSKLSTDNSQGEYYLTDAIALMKHAGMETAVVCGPDYRELLGINTVEQLAEAERTWREIARPGRHA
jgi:UDP-N-acetylglucosamine diphosphorylase/glucosamine-1-phosphate N-acetyltransferase